MISQGAASGAAHRQGVQDAYSRQTVLTGRPEAEIAAYFDDFDLVPPGLVPVARWAAAEPYARLPQPGPSQANMLAGVGRKRTATS